jgi:zinc transport system ATP-binding protein
MTTAAVEARSLRVDIEGRTVLHGVDITVDKGEVVALLGPNGSGKSTFIRAILRLIPATAGQITVFGRPLPSFRDWWRIGYVPQRTAATSGVPATVREVVATGRLARRTPFWPLSKADHDAIGDAIELVGLSDRAGDGVHTLSGGQQQRVLIARAAAAQPDLMVLDEPNAGVDQRSQEAFARALRTFVASGRTVLLVLHDMGPLAPLIDRSVMLDNGRVVNGGPLLPAAIPSAQSDHHDNREMGLFG